MSGSSREPETWKRPLSPPARDRATTFFMRQHVFGISGGSGSLLLGGGHEYLPILLREESAFGLLSTVVAAAGFAALSNAGNVAEWRSESFRLYQIAIVQLQRALQDPVQRVSDETLGAVLLMGTFDVQNFAPWIKPCQGANSGRQLHSQTPVQWTRLVNISLRRRDVLRCVVQSSFEPRLV
ncbi:unnamed protein product [Fusarium graminearum]|nr:unnamed protein product [Fusarium graminearum]